MSSKSAGTSLGRLIPIAAAALVITETLFVSAAKPSFAAAPIVGTQAPGFYRMMLGSFEITVLSDGTHPFPVHKVLTQVVGGKGAIPLDQAAPGEADALLAESKLAVPVQGSINAFLINTGSKLILIDSGAGSLYGDCCGHLIANLKSAGYSPDQVDEIYLTHLHADHVGGIAPNGNMAFKNAVVRVSQVDADYWLSDKNEQAAPKLLNSMFEGDKASLKPYIDAGKFKPFTYGEQLSPGITPIASPGHTPGHSFFMVESDGQRMLMWGDVVHVAAVQFPNPSVTLAYDSDAQMAENEREMVFSEAARSGYWIGAAHISFPGVGHVSASQGKYYWIPANYDGSPVQK
ncbi:MBL fold metallo-hydrolase [Oryzifoliimicrobium ureilyticus]|uniref:MBL fold metallo-hydrolase n=1 Tax=Oryzifoliimicrobium ureilyticus TaxID=3113724 RepID=UPI00307682DA